MKYIIALIIVLILAVIIALVIVLRRARAARLKKEMFDRAAANFSNLTNQEPVE